MLTDVMHSHFFSVWANVVMLSIVMLNVSMLRLIILSVVISGVIMKSVTKNLSKFAHKFYKLLALTPIKYEKICKH
jgi:hypothetical protein